MARTYSDGRGPDRGAWLLRTLTGKGLTPQAFAELSGISSQTVNRMINGGSTKYGVDIRFLRSDTAQRLAFALIRKLNVPFHVAMLHLGLPPAEAARWAAWAGVTIPPIESGEIPNEREIPAPRGIGGPVSCAVPCRITLHAPVDLRELPDAEPRIMLVREPGGKLETTLSPLPDDQVLGVVSGIVLGLGVYRLS